jgi:hypothetical protein
MVPMDRSIFNLRASVEATSLYILLCALADEREPLTLERARLQWNGTSENLLEAAAELGQRGVLTGTPPFAQDQPLHLNPSHEWC